MTPNSIACKPTQQNKSRYILLIYAYRERERDVGRYRERDLQTFKIQMPTNQPKKILNLVLLKNIY